MVYVFGLNVPLVEILIIFLVLLSAGLAFILVELRRLRQLLSEEKNIIHQFEDDLNRFESDEGKVHNVQVESYIRSALGRGVAKENIEKVLIQRGWDKETVDKILDSVGK